MNGRKPVVRPRQSLIWLLIGSRFKTGVSDPHLNHELLNKWHNRKFLQQVGGQGFVTDCYSKFLSHKKVGSHIVQFWLCKLELAFLPSQMFPTLISTRWGTRDNKVLLQLLKTWSFCIITCSRPHFGPCNWPRTAHHLYGNILMRKRHVMKPDAKVVFTSTAATIP